MTSCTKLLFDSGYKFRVPLDASVSAEVVVTRKSDTIRNFPCTVLQSPVVLTSLKAILVSTAVCTLKDWCSSGHPVGQLALQGSSLGLVGPVSEDCDWMR